MLYTIKTIGQNNVQRKFQEKNLIWYKQIKIGRATKQLDKLYDLLCFFSTNTHITQITFFVLAVLGSSTGM